MPLTRSRAELVDAVQRTADVVEFTAKHPLTRINDLVNQGLGALARICRSVNPKFQPIASTIITTDGIATSYPLPAAFRSLISVEYTDGDNNRVWLEKFGQEQRALLASRDVQSTSLRALGYMLVGSNIEFLPRPPEGHTALLWYATTVTQLTQDAQPWDTMERLDSYVIWWAAREIALERKDYQHRAALTEQMQELEAEIRILARSIDLSGPERITRAGYANMWGRLSRGWGWR